MFPATDWDGVYLPAIQALLSGANPYSIPGFYNPPWVLALLAPFAVLPRVIGQALMLVCALAVFVGVARKLGASPMGAIAIALSPLAFFGLSTGNVEWLALLGLALPLPVGLLLLAIKPQMTFVVIAFLVYREWHNRGLRHVFLVILPTAVAFAVSFMVYGPYPLRWLGYGNEAGLSLSFFPYLVPLGVVVSWRAFRERQINFAVAASPLFVPTLSPQIWAVEWLSLAPRTRELWLMTLGVWGVVGCVKLGLF